MLPKRRNSAQIPQQPSVMLVSHRKQPAQPEADDDYQETAFLAKGEDYHHYLAMRSRIKSSRIRQRKAWQSVRLG